MRPGVDPDDISVEPRFDQLPEISAALAFTQATEEPRYRLLTSRMAIDVLVGSDVSIFLHPAYVISLAADCMFDEPFDTRSIDFSAEGQWRLALMGEQAGSTLEYVVSRLHQSPTGKACLPQARRT